MKPDECKPFIPIDPVTDLPNTNNQNTIVPSVGGGFSITPQTGRGGTGAGGGGAGGGGGGGGAGGAGGGGAGGGVGGAGGGAGGGGAGGGGGGGAGGGGGGGGAGGGGAGGGGAGGGGGGGGNENQLSTSKDSCDPQIFKEGSKKTNVEKNKKTKTLNPSKNDNGLLVPAESQHAKTHGEEIPCAEKCQDCKQSPMYPTNNVSQTESGHIIEKDDTPGSERLSVSHRTGTYFEILPFGSFNATVSRDAWLSVYRDAHLHVDGYTNITLDKGLKIVVNKDKIPNCPEKQVNFDLFVSGNANLNIVLEGGNANVRIHDGDVNLLMEKGDVNIRQEDGNYNHYVKGDYNLQVDGHMHTVVRGDVVNEIGGFRDTKVWGDFDHLELEKGDLDINIKTGNEYLYIGGKVTEIIMGNYDLYCEKTVGFLIPTGNFSLKSQQIAISAMSILKLYSADYITITSVANLDLYTNKIFKLFSKGSTNIQSNADIKIQGKRIDLNGAAPDVATRGEATDIQKQKIPITKSKWTPTKSRIRECE